MSHREKVINILLIGPSSCYVCTYRYDYLQFTDTIGKQTFDDTFGSDRWPSVS